ncbi:MAG: hypothetical protein ACLQU2_32585 [Candidatus Binataceae bacterium]
MASPGGVALMRATSHLAVAIVLAMGAAIAGAGCTSTNAAGHAQAEAERAELAATHAEAAAANAQKAADAANVAALRAQKAVEDANREITAVEKRLDQLLKNAPKTRRRRKRHGAKASSGGNCIQVPLTRVLCAKPFQPAHKVQHDAISCFVLGAPGGSAT